MDPFLALNTAAAVTTKLKIGTGIALRDPARSDRHRQGGLVHRPALERPLPVRRRQRLEPGRDREPRHRLQASRHKLARERIEAMKTIWAEEEPEYHGEFVELRQDEAVAQACAEAASADHRRRRLPLCRPARDPLRRRLDSRATTGWRQDGIGVVIDKFRNMATEAGRDPASLAHQHLPRARQDRRACASARRSASTASSSPCRPRRKTRSCRSSTAGPSFSVN